jgi:DNA-binding CsgD family transcriptional regulator
LFSTYTIQEHVQKLEETSDQEEQLYKILEVYLELFPIRDAYLLRYSPLGYLGEGIFSLTASGVLHIREMRDDVRSVPIIYSAIREKKAKYGSGIDYFKKINSKYLFPSTVTALLVTPICFGSVVVGYICSSKFTEGVTIDHHLLSALTVYGKSVGKYLERSSDTENSPFLSKTELEVMRNISWGESTKEIADKMKLSELTINQYVKSAIKKLGVQNRVHAVGELFRRGIIH